MTHHEQTEEVPRLLDAAARCSFDRYRRALVVIDRALGERTGIVRFGWAYAPPDEALARAAVDLSGRPWPEVELGLDRQMLGNPAAENVTHFFVSLTMNLKAAVHIDVLRGDNDHHRAEAAFKALALALKAAMAPADGEGVPSTKGSLGSDHGS